ncbi:ribosome-inactivating family protein [Streptomyces sp. NPDC101132]|uniref:ribosome-inactivating family protein n=1 Tax=Streptomyces sp. NPDC101132 TaxID=3366110 RepID=UPI00380CAC02
MYPISAVRRAGRSLGCLLLALMATCTLVSANASPAQAQPWPHRNWETIQWNMHDFQSQTVGTQAARDRANRFEDMVRQLRRLAGHQIGGQETLGQLSETYQTGATDRIIQVAVWTNLSGRSQHHLSLYFNAANLYLVGFTSRGRHYQFRDSSPGQGSSSPILRTNLGELYRRHVGGDAPLFRNLGYTGNYNQLDSSNSRVHRQYLSSEIMSSVNHLIDPQDLVHDDLRRHLAFLIGATAESARFGWIQRRIAAAIAYGGDPSDSPARPAHLGLFGQDLQRAWSDLSILTHRELDPHPTRPAPNVVINGRVYRSLEDILGFSEEDMPTLSPFLTLFGSV